jgi:hypothetical protein
VTTPSDDAKQARKLLTHAPLDPDAAQVYATLALAEALTTAARVLAGGMVEAARIRRGQA